MRAAFVFDQELCTGCEACRVACGIENGGGRDTGWRQVTTLNPRRHPALPTRHLSLACNHCDRPACLIGCPAAAYRRDAATGAVLLDEERCIGCRYCSWVCPYDAPRYDEHAGVMRKCTFCAPRLAEERAPACAQACPTGALSHAPREAVRAEPRLAGLPSLGLGPALVATAPRHGARAGERPPAPPRAGVAPERKVRLASEWGLVLFTLALPALVGWFGAGLLRPQVAPPAAPFLGAGALVMALSALHLGRPLRAWRAIANVKSSWLSREVLFASAFLAAAGLAFLLPEASGARGVVAPAALLLGALALVSVDALYRVVPREGAGGPLGLARLHGSEAWLTGLLLLGLVAGLPAVWLPAAALKAVLAVGPSRAAAGRLPAPLSALRVGLLLAACALAAVGAAVAAVAAVELAGELLDRCRFYLELEPVSPRRLLAALSP